MQMTRQLLAVLVLGVLLTACEQRGDETIAAAPLPAEAPNSFLRYLNTQASLPAGRYEVVAATNAAGESGEFILEITFDDGRVERHAGAWVASGGQDAAAAGNPRYPVTLAHAGGIKVRLRSAVDGYLFLLRDDTVLYAADDDGAGGDATLDLALTRISSAAYANAYYAAVDPGGESSTLAGFLRRNCFIAGNPACTSIGFDTHVVFRDSKDLGYGRNMYARRNAGGSLAFYVDNYVIRLQQGGSTNYGPVNVEAAVREDRTHFRGTNAIEFSPRDPSVPGSEMITRFYTFNTAGQRITSADLDGRGVKHMPGMCWTCHGGRLLPLDENGDFPLLALRSAKLNQLEADSFDYAQLPGYTRADLEPGLKIINGYVHDSYAAMQSRDSNMPGKWFADFALEIAAGRYGGTGMPGNTYQGNFVPVGWQQTATRPEGVEELYTRVIGPHCVACHSLQGHAAGEAQVGEPLANAINFSSWERFISHRETVIDYVFHRGVMPLSLRNFEQFWRDPDDKPALLAAFLQDPALFDSRGKVIRPGHPVARPGADRAGRSPVDLDGSASSFATRYRWTLLPGSPGGASIADADTATPRLVAASDGTYQVSLVVANALGESAPATLTVTVDGSLPAAAPTFVADVQPLLENPVSTGSLPCTQCHRAPAAPAYAGIPVSYLAADNPRVYADVAARVNFAEPENSLLLKKPTGPRHGGGRVLKLETPEGRVAYETLLRWIRAGAPCGNDATICP